MQYAQTELQPIEICTQACTGRWKVGGEFALLGDPEPAARNAHPTGADPLAQVRDRAGPERDVHERVLLEDALALSLGVASAHRDHPLGVALLQDARVAEVRREPGIRLLADRAGVEDEDVRVLRLDCLAETELLEHALDPLGVVRVHLAPERRDVVALHAEDGSRVKIGR